MIRTIVVLSACVLLVGAVSSAAREALLMPGKTSLFQRVLTRPGAMLQAEPGAARAQRLPPLSVFHVYARETHGGEDWLEVGAARRDGAQGWIRSDKAIDWKQTLSVAFKRSGEREPVLFFRDREALLSVIESETALAQIKKLRGDIAAGRNPEDSPVIAVEPSTYVDPNQHFYLIPILDHRLIYLESGHQAQLLDVAAVTLQAERADPHAHKPEADLSDYRAAVVFVIDTTTSMGPFIDLTRDAVARVYRRLSGSPLGERLSFGLVAFRDNLQGSPGLGYVSEVVATLDDGRDGDRFLDKVSEVEQAEVSSKGFIEDAFAGVRDAIEEIDWSGYHGRYIVLITDAAARAADDPLSRDHLGPEALRLLASEKDQAAGGGKIAIAVLHLKTAAGRPTEARAEEQYRALSRWGDSRDLYFPIEGGTPEAFGERVNRLGDLLMQQLEDAQAGRLAGEGDEGDAESTPLAERTALVGRAMQLAYLGRLQGSRAPDLIQATILDRDPIEPARAAVQVRMLISKNQLSDLQQTLQAILAAGERTFMAPKDFFGQLRGAAAALARDAGALNKPSVKRLADVGLVGEWLEGLPYKSQVMNLTESRWLSRSYAQQQEVLDAIEEKILLYRRIHDDSDRWVPLEPGQPSGEAVTTVPLDALP